MDFWEPEGSSRSDEAVAAAAVLKSYDFWEAVETMRRPDPVALKNDHRLHDFWDPLPCSSPLVLVRGEEDWSDALALPLFEPGANENPFVLRDVLPSREDIGRRRARWLASLLDIPTRDARRYFADRFEELFDHFSHHNTFKALSDLALEGASADDILTAFQLRLVWADHPKFWSIRRKGLRGPLVPDGGEKLLGWTRAIRLADLAMGLPAERIIDEDWYEEWLRLPVGDPLFWSFLDYATARLESFAKGVLAVPETLARRSEGLADDFGSKSITIDGLRVGSFARTAIMMLSAALNPSQPIRSSHPEPAT